MTTEIERWKRLADFVERACSDLGLDSQAELAGAADISVGTAQRFTQGKPHPRKPNQASRTRVEKALGWESGTVRQILEGKITEQPLSSKLLDLPWVDAERLRAELEATPGISPEVKRQMLRNLGLRVPPD